ncbi:MAG: hypothetical protein ABJE10_23850 [bacterium]
MPNVSGVSPHRNFRDEANREWIAWDVIPSWGERRAKDRRRSSAAGPPQTGERRHTERRHLRGIRIALTPHLAQGWLAFEFNDERRRLVPIPPGWERMSETELLGLWRDAEPLPMRRRRLIE